MTVFQIGFGVQVREFVDIQTNYWGFENKSNWLAKAPILFYIHRSFSLLVLGVNSFIGFKLLKNGAIPLVFKYIILFPALGCVWSIKIVNCIKCIFFFFSTIQVHQKGLLLE